MKPALKGRPARLDKEYVNMSKICLHVLGGVKDDLSATLKTSLLKLYILKTTNMFSDLLCLSILIYRASCHHVCIIEPKTNQISLFL